MLITDTLYIRVIFVIKYLLEDHDIDIVVIYKLNKMNTLTNRYNQE